MRRRQQRRQRKHRQPNSAIFPDELMEEIVSWLPVKHILRLRCVNNFFNTLIFNPHFIRMHLNKSRRNSNLALSFYSNWDNWEEEEEVDDDECTLITLSIPYVLGNQEEYDIFFSDCYFELNERLITRRVVGSCNGLLCVISVSTSDEHGMCFWNPAMRTKSKEFSINHDCGHHDYKFSFGYDNSTQTYKVVAFYVEKMPGSNPKSEVKVFSLGDNSWKDLQCFPLIPLYWSSDKCNDNGVHLNGTINWLAYRDYNTINWLAYRDYNQYVILSLDLSTETYTKMLLPQALKNVGQDDQAKIVLLMDRLCFCHTFKKTHFVIWQMKDFGVQNSWIQLFKISYENSFGSVYNLLPLYLSENGDTLLLASEEDEERSIYSCIDNEVEKISNTNNIWWPHSLDYVESLVPAH